MEMLVTKFSKGKYRNESNLFAEPISAENVKLMGEMIALQALRTVKKFDMKIADKLYIGLIKDLHHMGEIDYIVSDGYDVAQTAVCFLYQFKGRNVHEIYGKDCKGKDISIKRTAIIRVGTCYPELLYERHGAIRSLCRTRYRQRQDQQQKGEHPSEILQPLRNALICRSTQSFIEGRRCTTPAFFYVLSLGKLLLCCNFTWLNYGNCPGKLPSA